MCVSHSRKVCVSLSSQSASVTRWGIKGSRVSLFFLPWFSSQVAPPSHPPPPFCIYTPSSSSSSSSSSSLACLASLSPPLPNHSLIFLPRSAVKSTLHPLLLRGRGGCFPSVRPSEARRGLCVCVQSRPPLFHSLSLSLSLPSLFNQHVNKKGN